MKCIYFCAAGFQPAPEGGTPSTRRIYFSWLLLEALKSFALKKSFSADNNRKSPLWQDTKNIRIFFSIDCRVT
jgi:hypothetical protein